MKRCDRALSRSIPALSRIPIVRLCLLLIIGSLLQPVLAQASRDVDSTAARYYLLQPYYADSAADRVAVLHIGAEVTRESGAFYITNLFSDYPAQQGGLRHGDKLLQINGKPFDPVTSLYQLSTAEPVTLALERNGEPLEMRLTPVSENLYDSRRSAAAASIQEFSAGNKTIAYYHPWSISRNLNDVLSFIQTIDSLALSDGLILDLRDSFGFVSIHHLDAFMPSRRTLFSLEGATTLHTDFDRDAPPLQDGHYGKPVAILINGNTAGGAELLAYQLAKMDRVTTVGEASAGELGHFVPDHSDGAQQLHYQPPNSTTLDGSPLTTFRVVPKLAVPYAPTETSRNDPQFEAAFNVLMGRI